MASIIGTCNRALTKLGSNRITSLDDNVKRARVMSAIYDSVRRSELRAHRWSFAMTRALLPALSTAPAWGYAQQFQLPADFIRLDQVGDFFAWFGGDVGNMYYQGPTSAEQDLYAIEGGKILTSIAAPLKVRYAADVTDPNMFDANFEEMLACKLAMEACEDLTQSSTKFGQIANEYADAQKTAVRSNAIERPPERLPESSWLLARL